SVGSESLSLLSLGMEDLLQAIKSRTGKRRIAKILIEYYFEIYIIDYKGKSLSLRTGCTQAKTFKSIDPVVNCETDFLFFPFKGRNVLILCSHVFSRNQDVHCGSL